MSRHLPTMDSFTVVSVLVTLAALCSYANHRFIGLPQTAALMLLSLALSFLTIVAGRLGFSLDHSLQQFLEQVDLSRTLLGGMLSFLLFAGALHLKYEDLHELRWRILSLAFVSTLLSTVMVAGLAWYILGWLGLPLPLLWCLLFGALISPTDPVAVLSLLQRAKAPHSLRVKFAGESLLNDGAGLVAYVFFLESLQATGPKMDLEWQRGLELLAWEAGGGVLLGLLLGWVTYRLIRGVDEYRLEVLLTLALVCGGYSVALALHTSGPLAIATAGLVIGNAARHSAMSEKTRLHLDSFWELVDEVLNAVLFVLLGLEIVELKYRPGSFTAALVIIPAVLLARWASVAMPRLLLIFSRQPAEPHGPLLLTWGGLRGAISVALALALPLGPERDLILTVTYCVVCFSILVQGTTMPWLLRRTVV